MFGVGVPMALAMTSPARAGAPPDAVGAALWLTSVERGVGSGCCGVGTAAGKLCETRVAWVVDAEAGCTAGGTLCETNVALGAAAS